MLHRYHDITADALGAVGFANPSQAAQILRGIAGNNVTDAAFERLLPSLIESLSRNADPDRALVNLAAWLERVGSRPMYFHLLTAHPAAMDAVLTVLAASQFLAGILIRNPEYFEVVANPAIRDRGRSMADYLADATRRIAIAGTPGKKRDALRRFKPPEVLRIGARDILGYAGIEQTITEISDFAEACVRAAVDICEAGDKFAVIGMGKLGARELNYASDIDLIFVHADDLAQDRANRLAESVRDALAKHTEAGFVFRVDLRLRPEGRFGAITRSLSGCHNYYESWAEPWERQALIKARFVGGDEAVGAGFIEIAERFVYHKMVLQEFVDAIREGKRALEAKTARAGEADSNVKQGIGAIRDIEFSVQLLQLMAGGKHPQLRVAATLPALDALAELNLITQGERITLAESYKFLREVEHRLQIMDERPVRTLPLGNPEELDRFGRRLGYSGGAEFLRTYRSHTSRVNRLFREVFYGESAGAPVSTGAPGNSGIAPNPNPTSDIAELVRGIDSPNARRRLEARLADLGFSSPADAVEMLRRSEVGSDYGEISPGGRASFEELAGPLLEAAAATARPDDALQAFDQLSVAVPSRAALHRVLVAEPRLLARLVSLAAQSPPLWETLIRHLEYLDFLVDESQLEISSPPPAADPVSVTAYIRRERIRIGACDLWGLSDLEIVMHDLTAVAERALQEAFRLPVTSVELEPVALIGMGKLGGAELGYGSDLDVVWVIEEGCDTERGARAAKRVMSFIQEDTKPYGASFEIDPRLRPDGRVGVLVRTVEGYLRYVDESAQTWEKQALIKARFVAGNAAVGDAFRRMARAAVYDHPPTNEQVDEMRHMKHRIETERCKDPADIKLGPGGLSDIEWTTQLLQWRFGRRWPKAQATGTLGALLALRDAAVIAQADWETLSDAYVALTALRNRQWLYNGGHGAEMPEPIPQSIVEQRHRVRKVFERLFLGAPG